MSAEISQRLDDQRAASEAAQLAGDILYETDHPADASYTMGTKAAAYGGEIVLNTLRKMGVLTEEIDWHAYDAALALVRSEVLPHGMKRREEEPTGWGNRDVEAIQQ